MPESGKVSSVDHDPRHELPSPVLLEVHAVVSKVLNITRKDREIDGLMRTWNEGRTLVDGGSTDVEELLAVSGFKTSTSGYSDTDG